MRRRTLIGGSLAAGLTAVAGCARPPGEPVPTGSRTPGPSVTSTSSTPSPSGTPTPPGAPTPTDPTPTAVPTPEPGPPRPEVTVALTGDMLWHDLLWQQALTDGGGSHDFAPQLEALSPAIEADLAVAHQEVPVGEPDGPFENYPAFVVPPQTLDGLRRVGFHAITTASNHSMDGGHVGLGRTLDAADRAGLAHAGTARSAEEQATPSIVTTASGVRIGLVAGAYGLNGYRLDRDKQWAWNGLDPDLMAADAARCRAAGADLVIAAVHAGVEYQTEPTSQQREVAHRLAESPDIDLVYGHHAHVVQPWEDHNGTWILYGLGNAMAAQSTKEPRTREGAIARITFRHDPTAGWWLAHAAYVPTLIQARPWRVYPLGAPEVSHRHRVEVGERTYRAITSWGAAGIYPVLHGL